MSNTWHDANEVVDVYSEGMLAGDGWCACSYLDTRRGVHLIEGTMGAESTVLRSRRDKVGGEEEREARPAMAKVRGQSSGVVVVVVVVGGWHQRRPYEGWMEVGRAERDLVVVPLA
jgi:hypothetical protein